MNKLFIYTFAIFLLQGCSNETKLTEEEAAKLADELSLKLSEGVIPGADSDSLKKMVAGRGDLRGALRLTFAKSLGAVGEAALPILCNSLRTHENVVVRRASAKTLNLIGSKAALPFLLEAFLEDDDGNNICEHISKFTESIQQNSVKLDKVLQNLSCTNINFTFIF